MAMEVAKARIQTSVLFSIFEQYQRRSESCPVRLVGALLGSVTPVEDNMTGNNKYVIEFRQCFPVPHSEVGDQISINSEYFKSRMELHKKSYGKETALLGWYSIQVDGQLPKNTDAEAFAKNAEFIRDYFAKETGATGAPIVLHLAIILGKEDNSIKYDTFSCEPLKAPHPSGTRSSLLPVPSEIAFGTPELFAMNVATRGLIEKKASRLEDGKLQLSIPTLQQYQDLNHEYLTIALQEAQQYMKSNDGEKDPTKMQKALVIMDLMGLSDSAIEENKVFEDDRATLEGAIESLKKQLSHTDNLFLTQPFTS